MTDRWFLTDCEGRLEIWREAALNVTRDADGVVTVYTLPAHYAQADLIFTWDLDSWDPGENAQIVRDHNEHDDLVAERDRLAEQVEAGIGVTKRVGDLADILRHELRDSLGWDAAVQIRDRIEAAITGDEADRG